MLKESWSYYTLEVTDVHKGIKLDRSVSECVCVRARACVCVRVCVCVCVCVCVSLR